MRGTLLRSDRSRVPSFLHDLDDPAAAAVDDEPSAQRVVEGHGGPGLGGATATAVLLAQAHRDLDARQRFDDVGGGDRLARRRGEAQDERLAVRAELGPGYVG